MDDFELENDGYVPNQYEPIASVIVMAAGPRFGRTSQFSKVFSFQNEEQTDYVLGLIFAAAFMLTFFFVWTVAIFVFMCLGQREAGFLSGHPFVEPEPSGDEEYMGPKPFKRPRRVRITFFACAILVVLFAVFFVTFGVRNIQQTTVTFSESNQQVLGLARESNEIATDLQQVGESSVPIRNTLVQRLGSFCPNDPDIKEKTGVDFDGIASQAVENLELLQDFVDNEVTEFREYVAQIESTAATVDSAISAYDVSEWKVMLYILPLIILPSFLLIGLIMAWFEVSFKEYQCILKYLIFPLFGIVIVFSWVFGSLFGIAATTNADFCNGRANTASRGPDATFLEIMNEQGIGNMTILFRTIEYYVDGCRTGFPFHFLDNFRNDLLGALDATQEFSDSLDSVGTQNLEELCGKDFDELALLLGNIIENLDVLVTNSIQTMKLLSCESLNSLYSNTFHEGTCTFSVTGFAWVFSSLAVISFCGMLMITFRAAVYEVVWYEGHMYTNDGKELDDESEHMEPGVEVPYVDDDVRDDAYYEEGVGSGEMDGTVPTDGSGNGSFDKSPKEFAQDQQHSHGQGRDW